MGLRVTGGAGENPTHDALLSYATQGLSPLGFSILNGCRFVNRHKHFEPFCKELGNLGALLCTEGLDVHKQKLEGSGVSLRQIVKFFLLGLCQVRLPDDYFSLYALRKMRFNLSGKVGYHGLGCHHECKVYTTFFKVVRRCIQGLPLICPSPCP